MAMNGILLAVALLLTLAGGATAAPLEPEVSIGKTLPGEECRIGTTDVPKGWNEPEEWAWKEICEGRIADFNRRLGEDLDPGEPAHMSKWGNGKRTLSPGFMQAILLHEPFRSAIPDKGITINAGYFEEGLDLDDVSIARSIVLHGSLFDAPVSMNRIQTPRTIWFDGSRVRGGLSLQSATIGGSLFLRQTESDEVNLRGARINGQLALNDSRIHGSLISDSVRIAGSVVLNQGEFTLVDMTTARIDGTCSLTGAKIHHILEMDSAMIGTDLFLRNATFTDVSMINARVEGQVELTGSTFDGAVNMDSVVVGRSLFLDNNATFTDMRLVGAAIGSQLALVGSTFNGILQMDSLTIGRNLKMRESKFQDVIMTGATVNGQVDLDYSSFLGSLIMDSVKVGSNLFMRGAKFEQVKLRHGSVSANVDTRGSLLGELDLSGTRIAGAFRLGTSQHIVRWKEPTDSGNGIRRPRLTLLNATVGTLQDTREAWPKVLDWELDGFTYSQLGGLGDVEPELPVERGAEWFLDWLERDNSFSHQPYHQLATVFRQTGHDFVANEILFALQDRIRAHDGTPLARKVLLTASWALIGYGYKSWWASVWILILVIVGCIVLYFSQDGRNRNVWNLLFYSLGSAIPLIGMGSAKQDFGLNLTPSIVRYFIAHRIAGLILISILVASMTGLVT